jgi:hypothetical protein
MKCMVQEAKSPVKNLVYTYIYIYIYVKFLALLGAPYIYDVSRLRVNILLHVSAYQNAIIRESNMNMLRWCPMS